jgi:hypothetical protein
MVDRTTHGEAIVLNVNTPAIQKAGQVWAICAGLLRSDGLPLIYPEVGCACGLQYFDVLLHFGVLNITSADGAATRQSSRRGAAYPGRLIGYHVWKIRASEDGTIPVYKLRDSRCRRGCLARLTGR